MASSGNFNVLNQRVHYSNGTFSNSNLTYAYSGDGGYTSTMDLTFKSYCEIRVDSVTSTGGTLGFRGATDDDEYHDVVSFQLNYQSGRIYHYKGATDQLDGTSNIGGVVGAGDIVMMAYDPATYKWWVGVDGTWRNSGDPANGTGFVFQGSATMFENMNSIHWGAWNGTHGYTITHNFGQDSTFCGQETAGTGVDDNGFGNFKYSPPTGFLATCSANAVVSTAIDPNLTDDNHPQKQFGVVTFTGNGSSRTISGLGFQPDLIWGKRRNGTKRHYLVDSNRGFTKYLHPEGNYSEGTSSDGVTSATSDGFAIGSSLDYINGNTMTYVAWCWRANGGTTSTNTSGDITSTVQANQDAGFSIMTWTGNGGQNQTIGHGLGGVPDIWIVKSRDATANWRVALSTTSGAAFQHLSGAAHSAKLNNTDAVGDLYRTEGNFAPTSTTVHTPNNGNSAAFFTTSTENFVGYCWRAIPGYSKFGFYTGDGTSNGPYVHLGFRPRLVITKGVSTSGWNLRDSERSPGNVVNEVLQSDTASAEMTSNYDVNFLSNGFKVIATAGDSNTNGNDYIYLAWADVPFKYNNAF